MKITRRDFLTLTATFVSGCAATSNPKLSLGGSERVINAGPAANYANDGVYSAFRTKGFFIVRRGGSLLALSAVCTHKKCALKPQPDRSFYCPCHGSSFDPDGHVKVGPAKRDLPAFPTSVNERGEVLVRVTLG